MVSSHILEHLDIFNCPACRADLKFRDGVFKCCGCAKSYAINKDGIPLFFYSSMTNNDINNVTEKMKDFYENNPFPAYDELDNINSLIDKAQKSIFANLLNEQIGFNVKVLEVGCGTGQMSNFLGISHRLVFATDICLNSLRLAQQFKEKHDLERVGFYQMNLFYPIFKDESFDLVICNGVLHHTSNPFLGFQGIAKLVRKRGFIILGLYNRYGRFSTDLTRGLLNIFGSRAAFLDPRIRKINKSLKKRAAWFEDQYKNPHESKHTFGEVLEWLEKEGFGFINSIPKFDMYSRFSEKELLFAPHSQGNKMSRFFAQMNFLLSGGYEGGLFLLIARRIK